MDRTPGRPYRALFALVVAALLAHVPSARAQDASRILVLPFRSIGVSDTTATVFSSLLASELENRRVRVLPYASPPPDAAAGSEACDQSDCAVSLARSAGADRVVYGSLSRLGTKVIVRVRAIGVEASAPDYADQLTALSEEDLDVIARRIAEGMAAGAVDASRVTINTVTETESETPRRRAASVGVGFRGGFLLPGGESYGGADHLSGVRMVCRYETDQFFLETTPVLGVLWGDGNIEWTLVDVMAGRIFSQGDWAPYFGGGLGVHAIKVERRSPYTYTDPYYGYTYSYTNSAEQTETTLTADIGGGMLLFRTYDFSFVVDLRYHAVFSSFDELGGKGAHGLMISFGTSGTSNAPARRRAGPSGYWR